MKIDRLLGIIMVLLYRRSLTVGELSHLFEVSERTIYRDLESLNCAGFPLDSSTGRGGGIGLLPGYRIEERLFSGDSLGIMADTLTALSEMLGDREISDGAALATGLERSPAERAIQVKLWASPSASQGHVLRRVAEAIRTGRALEILYASASGRQDRRRVEPLRLMLAGNLWYLQAWCKLREDYRLFRVQRIIECTTTQDHFDRIARLCNAPAIEPFPATANIVPVVLHLPEATPALLERLGNPPLEKNETGKACCPP